MKRRPRGSGHVSHCVLGKVKIDEMSQNRSWLLHPESARFDRLQLAGCKRGNSKPYGSTQIHKIQQLAGSVFVGGMPAGRQASMVPCLCLQKTHAGGALVPVTGVPSARISRGAGKLKGCRQRSTSPVSWTPARKMPGTIRIFLARCVVRQRDLRLVKERRRSCH